MTVPIFTSVTAVSLFWTGERGGKGGHTVTFEEAPSFGRVLSYVARGGHFLQILPFRDAEDGGDATITLPFGGGSVAQRRLSLGQGLCQGTRKVGEICAFSVAKNTGYNMDKTAGKLNIPTVKGQINGSYQKRGHTKVS